MNAKENDHLSKDNEDMIKIFLLCPVPEEQKPINEYIGLKENQLTNWLTLSKVNYEKKMVSFFLFFFVLVFFFRITFINPKVFLEDRNFLFSWLLINLSSSLTCLFFLIGLNWVRWNQLQRRFNTPRLFYEEASWYDGQIWEKPFSIIKNDRLVSTQRINPILDRIFVTLFLILFLNLGFLFFASFY
jgi:hypothetical protein